MHGVSQRVYVVIAVALHRHVTVDRGFVHDRCEAAVRSALRIRGRLRPPGGSLMDSSNYSNYQHYKELGRLVEDILLDQYEAEVAHRVKGGGLSRTLDDTG